ncbi:MAG: hypothetical protein ABL986_17705 [Vicinamibacterales bacterium]
MTGRLALKTASSVVAGLLIAGCASYFEIPIETPIKPKLDVSPFQRVLVAGFISGGSEDVDGNLETTRLLRSQLRTKSELRVIDADVLPLVTAATDSTGPERPAGEARPATDAKEPDIKDDKDLEPFEHLFADVEYWKKIGEEYQSPLIVTGTIMFTPQTRSGFVQREVEQFDSFGRRRVVPVRTYQERKGFRLKPKFVFIDGRTGTTLYSESFSEEILYNANQTTPALSSYFELMDRLIPSFLNTLSSQKVKGTRVLLQ